MWHLWNIRNHVHAVKIVLNMSDTDAHACFIIIIQHNISVTFMVPHGSIFDIIVPQQLNACITLQFC